MALSGSSPCRVRTRYLSVSSHPLPGPTFHPALQSWAGNSGHPSTEDDTPGKARQLCSGTFPLYFLLVFLQPMPVVDR